ncbi:MAG TPA: alpha,alpha-trehalose-phosphate synthase (UDP-forming) [Vicinamibacterales bacterium]
MSRLVVVSNRVSSPRERISRAGGLAVAIRDALRHYGGIWFGWSGDIVEEPTWKPHLQTVGRITFATVDLSAEDHRAYYLGYANSSLWPLFHYRLGLLEFQRADFNGYLRVNAHLAATLAKLLQPDDLIWVHDYHLIPLAAELRRLGVGNRIGFFLHTPFPTTEVLTALPGHEVIVESLCAYDLVGFQTANDVRALLDYISHEAGGRVTSDGIEAFGHRTRVGAFPIGIDTSDFAALAEAAANAPDTQRLRDSLAGRQLIIGVDRLDYSKGLPNRFAAFQDLLTRWHEHHARVTFLQIAPHSRGEIAQYRSLRRELEAMAGRINGRFAEFDWVPIRYLNKPMSRQTLAGFYRVSRVGFVSPLRDGMNLVAKEYVAAQDPQDPGVLVLSRFAGAAHELTDAIIVNPFDPSGMADALHAALVMPLDERRDRWRRLMDVLRRNTIANWREDFLATLAGIPPRAKETVEHVGTKSHTEPLPAT